MNQKAQSEVVGVILILTLVMLSIAVITAAGLPSLDRMQENTETERVLNEFTALDSEISTVTFGEAAARTVRLNTGGGSLSVDNSSGRLNITHHPLPPADSYEVYEGSIGEVRYENNDRIVAYQGGGVWTAQRAEEGSGMVSPPEFRFRGSTLTFPILRINSSRQIAGDARGEPLTVRQQRMDNVYPDVDSDWRNPVSNGTVEVTVESRYYEAWGRYFEHRTEGSVDIDHGESTATAFLDIEETASFDSGVLAAGANANELEIGNQANLASYDSSDGGEPGDDIDDACTMGEDADCTDGLYADGEIRTPGSVDVSNQGRVFGSIFAEGQIEISQGEVSGDIVSAEQACEGQCGGGGGGGGGTVYGDVVSDASIDIPDHFSPDPVVEEETSRAADDNDNSEYGINNLEDPDPDDVIGGNDDETIYLEGDVEINNPLEFDVSEANVTVAVDGSLEFNEESTIVDSSDNNTVTWYVHGDLQVTQGNVDVTSDDDYASWRNFFIVSSSGTVEIRQEGEIVAAIYAPDSSLAMGNNRDIYGALIVGDFTMNNLNRIDIFYDKDLEGRNMQILNPEVAITYMHVTENEVTIE